MSWLYHRQCQIKSIYYIRDPFSLSHLQALFDNWLIAVSMREHYRVVIMSAMASPIIRVSIVCSTVCSGLHEKEKSKLRVAGICEGNSPVTGEFPAQSPVTRRMLPLDDVIMEWILSTCIGTTPWNLQRNVRRSSMCRFLRHMYGIMYIYIYIYICHEHLLQN